VFRRLLGISDELVKPTKPQVDGALLGVDLGLHVIELPADIGKLGRFSVRDLPEKREAEGNRPTGKEQIEQKGDHSQPNVSVPVAELAGRDGHQASNAGRRQEGVGEIENML
jgi:hypothetical protein